MNACSLGTTLLLYDTNSYMNELSCRTFVGEFVSGRIVFRDRGRDPAGAHLLFLNHDIALAAGVANEFITTGPVTGTAASA